MFKMVEVHIAIERRNDLSLKLICNYVYFVVWKFMFMLKFYVHLVNPS